MLCFPTIQRLFRWGGENDKIIFLNRPFTLHPQNRTAVACLDVLQIGAMHFHRLIVDESHLIGSAGGEHSANEAFPLDVLLKAK